MEQEYIIKLAEKIHNDLMPDRNNEPLDGDETEKFCKDLQTELDKLNGNI